MRKYYEAYDERYKTAHKKSLRWFDDVPSRIVCEMIEKYNIDKSVKILEIGCGEGRDAKFLLNKGYDLLATDVSPEAINYSREYDKAHKDSYQVLDCVKENLPVKFDFIYAVAVIHMLVTDNDRNAFYRFVRRHLNPDGLALICTMGDGTTERSTDIATAFELQERLCNDEPIMVAGTSCRMVTFEHFEAELSNNGFIVVERGFTEIPLMFPYMMYAVVKKGV